MIRAAAARASLRILVSLAGSSAVGLLRKLQGNRSIELRIKSPEEHTHATLADLVEHGEATRSWQGQDLVVSSSVRPYWDSAGHLNPRVDQCGDPNTGGSC